MARTEQKNQNVKKQFEELQSLLFCPCHFPASCLFFVILSSKFCVFFRFRCTYACILL